MKVSHTLATCSAMLMVSTLITHIKFMLMVTLICVCMYISMRQKSSCLDAFSNRREGPPAPKY